MTISTETADRDLIAVPRLPAGLDTPSLVVDLDAVERNIGRLQSALDERGVRLRPHIKTHKMVPIARMQLEAGAAGVTVGNLGEAEVMADAGIDDVFVAYPIWASAPKARRLRVLHERIRLSIGVDSAEAAQQLARAVSGARPLTVVVEVDSGGHRTGVIGPERALGVARAARSAGLDVRGVFTHGGHSYRNPGAAQAAASDEVRALTEAAAALTADGFDVDTISAGSTPTSLLASTGAVNEMRAGTYALGDRQQLWLGGSPPDGVSTWVVATVVSRPAPDRFVIDAGAKSLTKDRADFLDGFGLIPEYQGAVITRLSDYHGEVRLPAGLGGPGLGDVLAIAPNHVCPVVDLFDEVAVVRGGQLIDRWAVDARGRSG